MSILPLGDDPRDASFPEHVVRRLANLRKLDRDSYNASLGWERREVERRQEAATKAAESALRLLRRQVDSFQLDEATRRAFTDLSDLLPADRARITALQRGGADIGTLATEIGLARERVKAVG